MNKFGKKFVGEVLENLMVKVSVIVDGMKPGIKVNYDLINADLERRRPKRVETKE